MKILVFSDSHDHKKNMLKAVEAEKPQLVLHCGDHDIDCKDIELLHPNVTVRTVRGNCDTGSRGLDIDEFVLDGVRFIMTHGHHFGVKMGLDRLVECAYNRDAKVALFGHTHIPFCRRVDNVLCINPGSIGMGSKTYAALELKNGKITGEIKHARHL